MYSDFGFYGGFTQLFPILFGVIFLIAAVMIVVTLIRGISQWNSNNHSPVLTVEAMVTSKRQEVSHRHSNQDTMDTYTKKSGELQRLTFHFIHHLIQFSESVLNSAHLVDQPLFHRFLAYQHGSQVPCQHLRV